MNKSLVNVTATFLSVLIAAIAAYTIYLNTEQNNIDKQILEEGAQIFNLMVESNISDLPTDILITNDLTNTISSSNEKNNYPTKLYQLFMVKNDLAFTEVCYAYINRSKYNISFANTEINDCNLPYKDADVIRLQAYLFQEYYNYITPKEYWTGKPRVGTLTAFPSVLKSKTSLFPLGLINAAEWSEDYLVIFNEMHHFYNVLNKIQRIITSDIYTELIKQTENPRYKKRLLEFNYDNWLSKYYGTYIEINKHNSKVQILLKQRDNFDINKRLPNLSWIILLSSVCFILGIVIPIYLEALEIKLTKKYGLINITIVLNCMVFIIIAF